MLEVTTNSDQYQIILDIVNNLLLFVDPKKTQSEEKRQRLWFKLAKKEKHVIKEEIYKMQVKLLKLFKNTSFRVISEKLCPLCAH